MARKKSCTHQKALGSTHRFELLRSTHLERFLPPLDPLLLLSLLPLLLLSLL